MTVTENDRIRLLKVIRKEAVDVQWVEVYQPNSSFQGGLALRDSLIGGEDAARTEMTEAQFADFLQKNEAAPIHAEAANCMFPGSIKLTGDNVDFEAIQTYVHHAIGRLAQAGIKIGVFGSGGRMKLEWPRKSRNI